MPFGRKSPLEALALPGVILAYKYSQFRQRRREAASRRITERELSALHHKIDKLLSKLEESEPDPPTSQEDECVICINARATMQTSPCGHRVVCRRCFVKTIQSAVAQRLLPLRCVICRARINRLTSNSGTWRIQESISNYSMGAKSWASVGMSTNGVIPSARSYSMNDASSGHSAFLMAHSPLAPTVPQSDSLYSMGSTGSSSANSKTSSISSELCSPGSPLSPKVNSYVQATHANIRNVVLNNHLTLPTQSISTHLLQCSTSGPNSLSAISVLPRETHHNSHYSHKSGCPTGCSGAVPRKPLKSLNTSPSGISSYNSSSCTSNGYHFMVNTHTYPGRRHIKGRLVDLQNRLPPIKEFRSPAKVPHPSPVHISNPRFRYASYTKSSLVCEDREPPSPPKRPMNIYVHASLNTLDLPPLKACSSKVSPFLAKHSIPKTAYINKCNNNNNNYITKKETMCSSPSVNKASNRNIVDSIKTKNSQHHQPKLLTANTPSSSSLLTASGLASASMKTQTTKFNKETTTSLAASNGVKGIDPGGVHLHSLHSPVSNLTAAFTSSKSFPLFYNSNNNNHNRKEKLDNKKNETVERRKEEKQKLKAEKEFKKEEKRLEKEEERLTKLLAKEGKKKSKNNVRELLLPNDVNSKK